MKAFICGVLVGWAACRFWWNETIESVDRDEYVDPEQPATPVEASVNLLATISEEVARAIARKHGFLGNSDA